MSMCPCVYMSIFLYAYLVLCARIYERKCKYTHKAQPIIACEYEGAGKDEDDDPDDA